MKAFTYERAKTPAEAARSAQQNRGQNSSPVERTCLIS